MAVGGAVKTEKGYHEGPYENVGGHNAAEYYDTKRAKWTSISNYPFSNFIVHYSVVVYKNDFFIFGGDDTEGYLSTDSSNKVTKLDAKTWKWSRAGNFNHGRFGHSVVTVVQKTFQTEDFFADYLSSLRRRLLSCCRCLQ